MASNSKILSTRTVYRGAILSVEEVDLQFANNTQATFERIRFQVQTGVTALPIDADGKILMIRHYQAGIDSEILSLPSGGLKQGEDPDLRMQTELREEIGFRANKLSLLTRTHLSPGYVVDIPGYLYLAEDLTEDSISGDEPFPIELVPTGLDDALNMIRNSKIVDIRAAYAILHYKIFIQT